MEQLFSPAGLDSVRLRNSRGAGLWDRALGYTTRIRAATTLPIFRIVQ